MPTGREWRAPIHRGTRSSEMVEGIAAVTGQRRDEIKLYDLRCVFNCFHRVPPRLDAASASIYDLRDKFARLTSALDRYRSIQCFQVGRNNWLSQSFLIFFSSFFVSFRRSSFPSFFPRLELDSIVHTYTQTGLNPTRLKPPIICQSLEGKEDVRR